MLVVALVLNGVALTMDNPLRKFFAPLRETNLIASVVGLDTVLVPILVIGFGLLLGVDDVTRAGLVIVAVTSAGPIGVALARVARGDAPLAITLVTGIGLLNLATIPLLGALLLPDNIPLPVGPVITSLASLLVLPLLLGRLFARALTAAGAAEHVRARLFRVIDQLAGASLAGAIVVALFLEPALALAALGGPVTPIAIGTMLVVTLAARWITADAARRRTVSIVVNARAIGLALTLTALHLGDVPGLRATVLAYGGLTQIIPIAVVLLARRWDRTVRR